MKIKAGSENDESKGDLQQPIVNLLPEVLVLEASMIENRRRLHRNPETAFEEFETAAFIAERLRAFGMNVTEGVGRTGVVGILQGASPGKCIALRADMDALPLQEENDLEFKSEVDGKMHACGHDGHVAILLCVAEILSAQRDRLQGTLKFIFQPAEETFGGAFFMIQDGVLENPHVDEIYGLHLNTVWTYGTANVTLGPANASNDRIRITITGSGGHGASPQFTEDVIMIGAALISQLHTIVSRNISALDSAVLSVTLFNAGTTYNIIPETATMLASCRAFTADIRDLVLIRIQAICSGLAEAHGVEINVEFNPESPGYPPNINNSESMWRSVVTAMEKVVPDGVRTDYVSTGSEDFAFFTQERPACYFRVGIAPETNGEPSHHSPSFLMDERSLALAACVWVNLMRDVAVAKQSSKT
uniref:Amidohydrolase n=2 Tax=Hirondellea gigas TaxID=1518452 RepID=A0A6A7G1X3_9CRUS